MRKPRPFSIVALVAAAAACTPETPIVSPTDISLDVAAPLSGHTDPPLTLRLPFRLSAAGVGVQPDPAPDCDDGFIVTGNVAHGTATHLGKFSSVHQQCVNLATGEFREGLVVYHAANGDELHTTFEGFLTPTAEAGVLSFDNPAHVAGGTGRFRGATGLFRAWGRVDLNENTFTLEVEGHLEIVR